ncbi:MAG: hypothetical protein IJT54_02510, partial [Candidatus Methanomethylophilaceae archaeon]|nr:hypothetical protein [Candidatus Methanomethylophilaceae archaeon]
DKSLKLYCYGTVYDANGWAIAEGIFTPYVYNNDFTVSTTGFNTMDQPGIVMLWNTSVDSVSGWDGTLSESRIIQMEKGMYFSVDEMEYDGESTSSITLKVKEIGEIGIDGGAGTDPLPVPKVFSAKTLFSIIAVEFGLIIGLLGYAFQRPMVIILGVVVAILGLVFPDAIVEFCSTMEWY